ncbi:MAG: VanZ family protein [Ruminococcus sp.]|nr:VanZ family protein [Ruminococcus sp.]
MAEYFNNLTLMRKIFLLLSLSVMITIFLFSNENSAQSSMTSKGIANYIVSVFFPDLESRTLTEQKEIIGTVTHIVRKLAHFSIYALLGFFMCLGVGKGRFLSLNSVISLDLCFLYACTDEMHQLFVAGRSGEFRDIIIDTLGSCVGIIISALICRLFCRIFKKELPQ